MLPLYHGKRHLDYTFSEISAVAPRGGSINVRGEAGTSYRPPLGAYGYSVLPNAACVTHRAKSWKLSPLRWEAPSTREKKQLGISRSFKFLEMQGAHPWSCLVGCRERRALCRLAQERPCGSCAGGENLL